VAVVFKENGHYNPKQDAERYVANHLRCQLRLRSYKKDDPKEVQQKSSSRLRSPPHPFLKIHRTLLGNGRACMSCPLLRDALVRVCEGTYSRAKAKEATVHQIYCLHQRRHNPKPQLSPLAESTVSDTLNHVAVVFKEKGMTTPNRMPSAMLHIFYVVN